MSLSTRDDSLVAGRGIEPVKVFDSGGRRNTVVVKSLSSIMTTAAANSLIAFVWSRSPRIRFTALSACSAACLERVTFANVTPNSTMATTRPTTLAQVP